METAPSIDRKKLSEENHNLIYWFCWKNHLDIDEWYDIIAIEYMKGINSYNETLKIKLSTYLTKTMKNGYLMELRNRKCSKRTSENEILSLDFEYKSDKNKESYDILNFIVNENSFFENDVCFKVDIKKAFSELKISKRNYEIFLRRIQGDTLEKIGSDFGLTRQRVRVICKDIFEKLKHELKENGVDYFEN